MVSIWEWENENNVEIIDVDGKAYRGNVILVSTAEEGNTSEDTIAIGTKAGIYELKQSEVQSIQYC